MSCKYYKNNKCQLILKWQPKRKITEIFCQQTCGLDGPDEETKLLFIDWAKAKQAAENAMQKIHEHKLQKLLAEMPKGWERTKILKIHAKQILDYYRKTNRGKVSEDEYQRRLAICKNCPDDKLLLKMSGAMICGKCSCNLNNINALPLLGGKAEWEALHCDMKHW